MYRCTTFQPVPPHSSGHDGAIQPLRREDPVPADEIVPRQVIVARDLVAQIRRQVGRAASR